MTHTLCGNLFHKQTCQRAKHPFSAGCWFAGFLAAELISAAADRPPHDGVTRQPALAQHSARAVRRLWQLQVRVRARAHSCKCMHPQHLSFVCSAVFHPARSCVADNSLGRAKKYMEVSGRPGPAEFHSAPWSRSPDSYNLTWKVDSYPPLQEVRLLYRKLMVSCGCVRTTWTALTPEHSVHR